MPLRSGAAFAKLRSAAEFSAILEARVQHSKFHHLPYVGRSRDLTMPSSGSDSFRLLDVACVALLSIVPGALASVGAMDDPLATAVEAARKTRDEKQLQAVKTQLEQKIARNPNDAWLYLDVARIQGYFADVYEIRKDKRAESEAADKRIEPCPPSFYPNDNASHPPTFLADLDSR